MSKVGRPPKNKITEWDKEVRRCCCCGRFLSASCFTKSNPARCRKCKRVYASIRYEFGVVVKPDILFTPEKMMEIKGSYDRIMGSPNLIHWCRSLGYEVDEICGIMLIYIQKHVWKYKVDIDYPDTYYRKILIGWLYRQTNRKKKWKKIEGAIRYELYDE